VKADRLFLLVGFVVLATGTFGILYDGMHRLVMGEASYSTEAIFQVPDSSIQIVLERRAIHMVFAEYERTLVVRDGVEELLRKEVAVDTGGYSRMNVFRITPTRYFLCGEMSFDRHFLDFQAMTLEKAELREKPETAKFLGAFERDNNRHWRFVTAFEKGERRIESCQNGGVQVLEGAFVDH
jgi:hypothetical protein